MMPVPAIKLFPDPVLRKPAKAVRDVRDPVVKKTIRAMEYVMRHQRHGIGIAAPQIGVSLQIALVDVSRRVAGARPLVLINPEILSFESEIASREGCMSLPDYVGNLKRYERIKIKWFGLETGVVQVGDRSGIEAVCIQHEIDHLKGALFIDRIGCLKRDLIPRLR